jgi:predicted nucleic acid-binding protein
VILLDASILSLAYGRRSGGEPPPVVALREMIRDNATLAIPGIAMQELLTAVKSESQSEQLRTHLSAFEILLATERRHAEAARLAQRCRTKRVECTPAEALVAAHTMAAGGELFTVAANMEEVARAAGVRLFNYRKRG